MRATVILSHSLSHTHTLCTPRGAHTITASLNSCIDGAATTACSRFIVKQNYYYYY